LPPRPLSAEELRLKAELTSLQRQMDYARLTTGEKFVLIAIEAGNIPRTLLTTFLDISGIMRQGRMLMQRYPDLAPQFVSNYLRAFASEDFALALEEEYRSNPHLPRLQANGLEVTAMASPTALPAELEERYMATPILERIPGVGKYAIRPTERSFTASLNWYRVTLGSRAIAAAEAAGKPLTDADLRILCSDINDLSGRSSISGGLKRLAPFINILFSPRHTISRLKVTYYKPFVEVARMGYQIAKGKPITVPNTIVSWISLIATNLLIMGLVKWLYPDAEIEPDLRATDGGKVKIGNTRYDLWAGNLPFLRTGVRLISGKTKTAAGKLVDTDYKHEIWNVVRARENPLYSLINDAVEGRTYIGEEFGAPPRGRVGKALTGAGVPDWMQGVSKEVWNRMGPLTMQDFADAFVDSGLPAAISAAMLSGTGTGVVTYPERAATALTKFKDQIAQKEYGKNWENLGPGQVADLVARHWKELAEEQLKVDVERGETTDFNFIARLVTEEHDVGDAVLGRQKPEVRQTFKALGVRLGLSRRFGEWLMNDERYQAYQDAAAKHLNEQTATLLDNPEWQQATDVEKQMMLKGTVDAAKGLALNEVLTAAIQKEEE